jgi:hypothetical protein
MYAKNCTQADLENAAGLRWRINIEDRGSKGLMFTLRHYNSSNEKYIRGMKRTPNLDGSPGRRTNSLCLHEHYRYFRRLFLIAPDAIVESSYFGKIRHTADTLDENYENMRYIMLRQWDGLMLDDCCNCSDEVKENLLEEDEYLTALRKKMEVS